MSLRSKIAEYIFRRARDTQRKVERRMINLADSKKIGVLFNCNQPEDEKAVMGFIDKLQSQGKKVVALSYYGKNILPHDRTLIPGHTMISKKDLSWYGLPSKQSIAPMANESFDLLINLCTDICIPLLMVSASSKASFRIGRYFPDAVNCFDFMMETKSDEVQDLITQTEHFLKQLKTQ